LLQPCIVRLSDRDLRALEHQFLAPTVHREEGVNPHTRIPERVGEPFPFIVVKDEEATLLQKRKAHHGVGKRVSARVTAINLHKVLDGLRRVQLREHVLAQAPVHYDFTGLNGIGEILTKPVVKDVFECAAVLGTAFPRIHAIKTRLWMRQKGIDNPTCRATLEAPNLKSPDGATLQMSGPTFPIMPMAIKPKHGVWHL